MNTRRIGPTGHAPASSNACAPPVVWGGCAWARLLRRSSLALAVYAVVGLWTGFFTTSLSLVYSTPDSSGYRECADWLRDVRTAPPGATSVRPLVYPLLLAVIRSLSSDPRAVWLLQVMMWLATAHLVSATTVRLSGSERIGAAAFLVFICNVSAIVQTYHALAETTAMLLLAAWTTILAPVRMTRLSTRRAVLLVVLLSLLTLTRPGYFTHWLLFMSICLVIFRKAPQRLPAILSAGLPVLLQMFLMYHLHGRFTVSMTGRNTMREYYLSKLFDISHKGEIMTREDYYDGLRTVRGYSTTETAGYLLETFPVSMWVFIENVLRQNLLNTPTFLARQPALTTYAKTTNAAYCCLHGMIPLLFLITRRRRPGLRFPHFSLLLVMSWIIFLSAGISFWQGDRLIMPAMVLWLPAYGSFLHRLLGRVRPTGAPDPDFVR
ncbi:hypothetical protein JW905_00030 [bacterium]|nr:hypothetical protein [candidate division CSSED10-310 bacterium]